MKFSDKAAWIFSGLMLVASSVYAQNSITALNASDSGNGTTAVKVEFSQPLTGLPAGAGVTINNPDTPPRIVLDFSDMSNGIGKSDQEFNTGSLRSAKITQAGKGVRLELNLDRMLPYTTKVDGKNLLIVLEGNAARPSVGGSPPQELRNSPETKIQAKNPETPFVQPELIPAKKLPGGVLQQATALIRGGKAAVAGTTAGEIQPVSKAVKKTVKKVAVKKNNPIADQQLPDQPVEVKAQPVADTNVQIAETNAREEAPKPGAETARQPTEVEMKKVAKHELLRRLVYNADIMIKNKKAAEAYALLEPHEGDYSGEIPFDYLLGMAALDSGKPDRATIAFERVLAVNPNFSGARLDLARAYFAMGSDDLAKKEFETVLAQNPPEPTAVVIKKHLDAIEERQQAKIQQITAYLETSVGHDDNITAATPDNVGGVAGILGVTRATMVALQYQPTGSSLHYSGMYTGVSGGVDFNRLVSEENGISLFAGADAKQRVYNKVAAMNNLTLDLRAGVGVVQGDNSYRLTGTFGQYRQSGFPQTPPSNSFRDTAGLSAEWKHSFGERDQMTWSLGISRPRYLTTPAQDTDQKSLSASWLHIFEDSTNPLIFANLNRSVDRALRPINAATGTNMGRTNTGVLAHFQFTPLSDTDFFLSGGVTKRHDDSPGARSPGLADFFASDETRSLSFGVTTRPWKKWTIKGSVALTDNRSNLSLYQYRRNDSSVSLRRDF